MTQMNRYNTDKQKFKKRNSCWHNISDVSGFVITHVLNIKIGEVVNKIPITSSLVATTFLNAKIGEIKKPNYSDLVKKIDYNAKSTRHWGKIIYYFWL